MFFSRLVFLAAWVFTFAANVNGLIFPLENENIPVGSGLVPSLARPMFAAGDAPFNIFSTQSPHIRIKFSGSFVDAGESLTSDQLKEQWEKHPIKVVSFVADVPSAEFENGGRYINANTALFGLCSPTPPASLDVTEYNLIPIITDPTDELSAGSTSGLQIDATVTLPINTTGYHHVALLNCGADVDFIDVRGDFEFLNPHGYLPGGWYLKLPLTMAIIIGYTIFTIRYVVRCCMYRDQILYLQYGIIFVLFMGFVEQMSYYFTFNEINSSGALPCCPVRQDIGFCLIISVLKRATLVVTLLAVSLGYGTQRPFLTKKEIFAVAVLGTSYVVASVNYEVKVIEAAETQQPVFTSAMVVSLLNLVVISWIYLSIMKLTSDLKSAGQVVKLEMYQSLAKALILWVAVGFLSEIVFYSILSSAIVMPWKLEMIPTFVWDLLFFFLVCQIAILWFPSEMTSQYAYSNQIPTNDLDDFDDKETGVELPEANEGSFVIGEEDDDDDVEEDFGEFDAVAKT